MIPELIANDKTSIVSLVIDDAQRVQDWTPRVGSNGVTAIEAYNEFGQGEYGLWFAIILEGEIVRRVNGRYVVEVGYAK